MRRAPLQNSEIVGQPEGARRSSRVPRGTCAAAVAVIGLVLGTAQEARAQACVDASCLCEPAGATNGVYWATVDGGNQATVVQIVEPNTQGSDPDVIVVPGLNEPPGTEILYTDNGYLVVAGSQVVCPGDRRVAVSRGTATMLVRADDCFGALKTAVPNACASDPLTCTAAPPAAGAPWLAALVALAYRRRRPSASMRTA